MSLNKLFTPAPFANSIQSLVLGCHSKIMLKFFRVIRQQLVNQNQMTKYLGYALGEIVLVVIGILIALSLDAWNQNRNDRQREILALTNLCSDLVEQETSLTEYQTAESGYFQTGISILKHHARHGGFAEKDSVLPKLNSLASRRTFNPVNTTFRELVSTGTIGLIQNDSLRRAIQQYYLLQERFNLIISNNNARLVDELFNPVLFEHTLFLADVDDPNVAKFNQQIFDDESIKTLKATSETKLADPGNALHLFNVLQERIHVAESHMERYEQLQTETNQLLRAIKTELNHRK